MTTSGNCSGGPRSSKAPLDNLHISLPREVLCNLMYIPKFDRRDTQGVPETFRSKEISSILKRILILVALSSILGWPMPAFRNFTFSSRSNTVPRIGVSCSQRRMLHS